MRNCLAALFSLSLLAVATPALAQTDAGSADAGQEPCVADQFESNDSPQAATAITAGSYDNLTGCDADEFDWYSITVPANQALSVEIDFLDDDADLDLYIYGMADGSTDTLSHTCASCTGKHSSAGTRNSERVWLDDVSVNTEVYIAVKNFNADDEQWAAYSMNIELTASPLDLCAPGDGMEPNDSMADAKPLTVPGVTDSLIACDGDWYSFTVPANNGVVVEMAYDEDMGVPSMKFYEAAATDTVLHSSYSNAEGARLYHLLFDTATPVLLFVENSREGSRVPYSLNVTLYDGGFDPCAPGDSFEPNNEPENAKAITTGETTDLTGCNDDWYSLTVPANNGLVVDMSFADSDGDLNLYLYKAGVTDSYLHSSSSMTDNEKVYYELFDTETQVLIYVHNNTWREPERTPYSLNISLYDGGYDPCSPDDNYEPNDNAEAAAAISVPVSDEQLILCDEDWYAFSTPANQGADVVVTFVDEDADLDMEIFSADDTDSRIGHSAGTSDSEEVCVSPASSAQNFVLRIYEYLGDDDKQSPYSLDITLRSDDCEGQEEFDAGQGEDDGGTSENDAATANEDGGSSAQDAATGGEIGDDSGDAGCGCQSLASSPSSLLLALFGLTFVGLRRRRFNV